MHRKISYTEPKTQVKTLNRVIDQMAIQNLNKLANQTTQTVDNLKAWLMGTCSIFQAHPADRSSHLTFSLGPSTAWARGVPWNAVACR